MKVKEIIAKIIACLVVLATLAGIAYTLTYFMSVEEGLFYFGLVYSGFALLFIVINFLKAVISFDTCFPSPKCCICIGWKFILVVVWGILW